MTKKNTIPASRVRDLVDYDPITGVLTRKNYDPRVSAGQNGYVNKYGYRYMSFDGEGYLAQRLAWAWVHGEWPSNRITFLNGDKSDLRLENLAAWKRLLKTNYDHSTPEGRAAWQKADRVANPDRYKQHDLKKSFGIGLAEYTAMAVEQNGCCAICEKQETETRLGKVRALSVDHNHKTNAVRGLLCQSCNKLIGLANEDAAILGKAITYLRKHSGEQTVPKLTLVNKENG